MKDTNADVMLADIRNKMSLVTHFIAMYELRESGTALDNIQQTYIVCELEKALPKAKEVMDWLRDDNNF